MISIKTDILGKILTRTYHPFLVEVLEWFSLIAGFQLVFTSGYRLTTGVHGTDPCRAMDIRSRVFQHPQAVADMINARYEYDPLRPEMQVAIYHDVGRGKHIHIQVHGLTRRRE